MSAAKPYGQFATAVLRDLYRQHEALETQQGAAEASIAAHDTGNPEDWDEHDRACAEHDKLSDELADIGERIAELEASDGF